MATLCCTALACTSVTTILSRPPGAKLYLNGEPVGHTPYTMADTKIVGSTTTVRMELAGFEPVNGTIVRNEEFEVGACIGGVFLLFPFLWIMGYKPTHYFELQPSGGQPGWGPPPGPPPGYPPAQGYPPGPPAQGYPPGPPRTQAPPPSTPPQAAPPQAAPPPK